MTCRNNQCEPTCPEGERRCSNNQPQICRSGNWDNDGSPCRTPCTFCSNGTCQNRPRPTSNGDGTLNGTVCESTTCRQISDGVASEQR